MLVVSYLCTYLLKCLVLIVTYLPSVGPELPMHLRTYELSVDFDPTNLVLVVNYLCTKC